MRCSFSRGFEGNETIFALNNLELIAIKDVSMKVKEGDTVCLSLPVDPDLSEAPLCGN